MSAETTAVLAKPPRLRTDLLFGLADQAVVSGGNFAIGAALLYTASKSDYGHYGLGYTTILLVAGLAGAGVRAPLTSGILHRPQGERASYAAAMLILQLLCLLPVLALGGGLLASPWSFYGLAILAGCGACIHEFARALLLTERAAGVFWADLVQVLLWGALVMVGRDYFPVPEAAVGAYGLAGFLVGSAILLQRTGWAAGWRVRREVWHDARLHGGWVALGVLVIFAQSHGFLYLLAAFAGAAAVAEVNAARLLMAPLGLAIGGVGRVLVPHYTRLVTRDGLGAARRLARKVAVSLAVLIAGYGAALAAVLTSPLQTYLPPGYEGIALLVLLWGLIFIGQAARTNVAALLQAVQRYRVLTLMNAWTAAASLGSVIAVAGELGPAGCLAAIAICEILLWLLLVWALRRPAPLQQTR
ncbi:hypothetical protein ACFSM5_21925 [Lacibacterium aquatile]|uniref:O-antigen/teichoic acid export membrane protein n=1 Tax=Lacibacterium aquatile TaxID=1168082 RepID=A0ABW5DWU0_9PROT